MTLLGGVKLEVPLDKFGQRVLAILITETFGNYCIVMLLAHQPYIFATYKN